MAGQDETVYLGNCVCGKGSMWDGCWWNCVVVDVYVRLWATSSGTISVY